MARTRSGKSGECDKTGKRDKSGGGVSNERGGGGKKGRGGNMAGRKKRLLTNKVQFFLEDSLTPEDLNNKNTDIVTPSFKPNFMDVYGKEMSKNTSKKLVSSKKHPYMCSTCSKGYISRDYFLTHTLAHTREKLRHVKPKRQHIMKDLNHPTSEISSSPPSMSSTPITMALSSVLEMTSPIEETCQDSNAFKEQHQVADTKGRNPHTASFKALEIRPKFSYSTLLKVNKANYSHTPNAMLDTTIDISDDEDMFYSMGGMLWDPTNTKLNTTIYVSDDTDTPRKTESAKKRIVAKRLFSNYPLRQNEIKDGGFTNPKAKEINYLNKEAIDKISQLGGISFTKLNSGEESTECFKEAMDKVSKLGPGISLTRLSS